MRDESDPLLCPMKGWIEELLAGFEAEIRARGLLIALEFDPDLVVHRDAELEIAIQDLCRLIFATVPDDCEIYFGGARSVAPVSRIGSGQWSARWQVAGDSLADPAAPIALRPRPGDASRQLRSPLAARVREAFAATRWTFQLEAIEGGVECRARGSFE